MSSESQPTTTRPERRRRFCGSQRAEDILRRMPGLGAADQGVLIIGWGFIGSAVGRRLAKHGVRVTGLTRSRTWRTEADRRENPRVVVGDITRMGVLDEALRGVDRVLLAAGGLTPPAAAANPSEAATAMLLPLLAVLEALRRRPSVALTTISSGGAVYGDPVHLPARETDPTLPISPYGATHRAAELYAETFARRFGTALSIARCANVYGPQQAHDRDQGAVAIFLNRIIQGLPIRVFGEGLATRDYVFLDDVSYSIARLMTESRGAGIVNIGSGCGLRVLDIMKAISDSVGRRAIVEFEPDRGIDVRAIVLDISKLQSLIPYTPTDFARGLEATHAAYVASATHDAVPTVRRR
jgi:UDP-glucose 4-epimerase